MVFGLEEMLYVTDTGYEMVTTYKTARDHRDRLILDLDDEQCLDPGRAGAKAAWLARGRRAGLPILPGVVVSADVSMPYLQAGADALPHRGSGGARLVVGQAELPAGLKDEIRQSATHLTSPLVVRSSSLLEGSGKWSGAFTSYLDVNQEELPKAVAGCWASAFTVSTLERFSAAGIDPAAAAMAVLIQPALQPDFGGTARLDGDEATVIGVRGFACSPRSRMGAGCAREGIHRRPGARR